MVRNANEEPGVLALRPGSTAKLPALSVGARVRIALQAGAHWSNM